MANARKRKARKARRVVNRGDRIKATPETLAKLRPHPLEVLLARGREGGGIDADQWQCAEEIVDAAEAITRGLAFAHADLIHVNYALGGHGAEMSPHEERIAAIWFAWAEALERYGLGRPFDYVEQLTGTSPCEERRTRLLCRALDLWAKVRRDLARSVRDVSTIRPNPY